MGSPHRWSVLVSPQLPVCHSRVSPFFGSIIEGVPCLWLKSCGMWDSGIIKMVSLTSDHKLVLHHTVEGTTKVGRWIIIIFFQISTLTVFPNTRILGRVVAVQLLCMLAQRNNCSGISLGFQSEKIRLSEPTGREYSVLTQLVFALGTWQHSVFDAEKSDVFQGSTTCISWHSTTWIGRGFKASWADGIPLQQLELPCLFSLQSLSRKEHREM